MSNQKEINLRGPKYRYGDDERKLIITIETTPAELRLYASYLEEGKQINVNWYHSRISFINKPTEVILEREDEIKSP